MEEIGMLYQKPWIDILKLEVQDVVRTSGDFQDPDNPDNSNNTENLWP